MMKRIKKWFNLIFLRRHYKVIVSVKRERYQDQKGLREIDVLGLECGCQYWIEIPSIGKDVKISQSKYLCDSCLKKFMEEKDVDNQKLDDCMVGGNHWGEMWWKWSKSMKGVDRRMD